MEICKEDGFMVLGFHAHIKHFLDPVKSTKLREVIWSLLKHLCVPARSSQILNATLFSQLNKISQPAFPTSCHSFFRNKLACS